MDQNDQKEGLFKRVKGIGDKSEELLKEIKNERTKESDKKDSKTAKTKNSLVYGRNHNFYKYWLDKFVEMPSIQSKFDVFETFYKDVICLKDLETKTRNITNHKFAVLNNASNESNKLIKEYKKVYKREPKNDKGNDWKKNMTLKIWKL